MRGCPGRAGRFAECRVSKSKCPAKSLDSAVFRCDRKYAVIFGFCRIFSKGLDRWPRYANLSDFALKHAAALRAAVVAVVADQKTPAG